MEKKHETIYKVVTGDCSQFECEINELSKEGYIVWGNMEVTHVNSEGLVYSQLMAKTSEIKNF